MRALRYYGPKDVRLEHDVPEPICGPSQVKIRPAFVGICGTDLHEYHSQTLIPKAGKPHRLSGETVPITLGHEISGTVVELGSELPKSTSLKVGDRVAVLPLLYCGVCVPCKNGHPNCCVMNGFLGISGGSGGLGDYACVDADAIFKLPDNVSLEVGALVEPLAVAWHAVSQSGFQSGQDVLVFGAGPIGLAIIICVKAMGAGQIIAAEVAARRQEFAREFGATQVIDPSKVDVVEKAKELTGGLGPPVAFDCAGVPASLEGATRAVCARGTIVNVAVWNGAVPFAPNNVLFHEKRYIGSLTYRVPDFEDVIEALRQARIHPEPLITRKISIDRVVEDGFETLTNEKDKHVKIIVDMAF